MPKIWQVMVSIILINFEHEDHEGDGPFKIEMNWVLELLLLSSGFIIRYYIKVLRMIQRQKLMPWMKVLDDTRSKLIKS